MDLTPELLRTVEFHDAKKGGYDHDEVDEFLDRAAADLARQHAHLREAESRVAAAEQRAAELESKAERNDSDETLRRTLVLAQRTADAAIQEAQEEAGRVVDEARQKAQELIAAAEEEVQRDVGATRDRLEAEIRELESRRGDLHHRFTELGAHLDAERERLRSEIERLRDAVEGDTLRVASPPGGAEAPTAPPADTASAGGPAEPVDATVDDGPARDDDEDLSELPPPPIDWTPSSSPEPDPEPPRHSSLFGRPDEVAGSDAAAAQRDLPDGGPPTEATPAVPQGDVGSAHLDELRRAVSEAPAPEQPQDDDVAMAAFFDQDDDEEERSRRFGRRR